MSRISKASSFSMSLVFSAAGLMAADPSWAAKPTPQWSAEDAKQVLTNSPWIKKVTTRAVPTRTEAQQREGGKMGGGQGVGTAVLSPATLFGGGSPGPGKRRARASVVEVRWESALPVRVAEKAVHDTDAPDWEGNYYVLAVYDVPGLDIDDKSLSGDLKRAALLKLDDKRALKPERVDCLPQVGGLMTVVYLFPRTIEIKSDDKRLEFEARFGQLALSQYFYTAAMQLQGALQL
jgi:hypothetical protein